MGAGHSNTVYLNCLKHEMGLRFPSHVSSSIALPVLYQGTTAPNTPTHLSLSITYDVICEGREIAEYPMDLLVMPGEGQGGCAVLVESTKTAEALEICHRFVLVLVLVLVKDRKSTRLNSSHLRL